MDCRNALLLISPHLDGALTTGEDTELAKHLADCPACARKLAMYRRQSDALREIGQEAVEAPLELCGLVMDTLRAEQRPVLWRLPAAWRRAVAAAAAILLLAGGSAGVTAGMKLAGGGKIIATKPVQTTGVDNGDGYVTNPGVTTPGVTAPGNNTQEGEVSGGTEAGNTGAVGAEDPGKDSATIAAENTPGENKNGDSAAPSGTALLNDRERKVTGTILKAAVDDISAARAKAVALAAGAGASTQVFPEQDGGKDIVVIRLAAPSASAAGLITDLSGIGRLFDRTDEVRDITTLYNETMVQYLDLQSRIGSSQDVAEQGRMEAQAATYKAQLEAWDTEAGRQIITLWLEGN